MTVAQRGKMNKCWPVRPHMFKLHLELPQQGLYGEHMCMHAKTINRQK
jgi:hypothetical protein